MSLDDICYLVTQIFSFDEIGQEQSQLIDRMVFCKELPTSSNEFFKAAQNDIKVQKVIALDSEEYEGETIVKIENVLYSVYRVYKRDGGLTELYCEMRSGNG